MLMAVSCCLAACSRGIGDSCESALLCSASATRLCDMTQPGGYCTLAGCQEGSCPSESTCVTFWQDTARSDIDRNRLSVNYCMRKCDERSDCRDSDGYDCLSGKDFGYHGEATVEGQPDQKFCAVRLALAPAPDAGMSNDTGDDAGLVR
jgi:hypothetical protein